MQIIKNLEKTYCLIDEFVKLIEKEDFFKVEKRGRKSFLTMSEYITLGLLKIDLNIESMKSFFFFIKKYHLTDFKKFPSYQQFCYGLTKAFPYATIMMQMFMQLHKKVNSDFFIIDSSALPICSSILRKSRVRRDGGYGKIEKNLNGFYFGFKLHAIINQHMQFVSFRLTPANKSDLSVLDQQFLQGIQGKLVGDKGYISKDVTARLRKIGIELITKSRKNMKKLPTKKSCIKALSQRYKIETAFSLLKYQFGLISKFARSLRSFFSQVVFSILTYSMQKVEFNKLFETFIS